MTVAENFVLARDHVPAVVNWPRETGGAGSVSGRHAVSGAPQLQGFGDLGR